MDALAKRQETLTELMRENDVDLMKELLAGEDRRLQEAEEAFTKAQTLISAQVFHEVRNALSSIVAMSEMTKTLRSDDSLTADELVDSVDEILDQSNEVVNYALKMLNDILDVTKIKSGAFIPRRIDFNLSDVVARATRMQQAKAHKIKMSFVPLTSPESCIAFSDPDIVERTIATLISNAVKLTMSGAVQPFICPLEDIPNQTDGYRDTVLQGSELPGELTKASERSSEHKEGSRGTSPLSAGKLGLNDSCSTRMEEGSRKMTMMAVGVADTGTGLTEEMLESAKVVIASHNSKATNHGAQGTGFGLYHAHLQTKAINTSLQLARVEDCRGWLNEDMLDASMQHHESMQGKNISTHTTAENGSTVPGPGTILYFAVPAYTDAAASTEVLQAAACTEVLQADEETALESNKNEQIPSNFSFAF